MSECRFGLPGLPTPCARIAGGGKAAIERRLTILLRPGIGDLGRERGGGAGLRVCRTLSQFSGDESAVGIDAASF